MKSARRSSKNILLWCAAGVLGVVALTILATGLFLKKGIHLDHLNVGPLAINELSLIWHRKLELEIDTLIVADQQQQKDQSKTEWIVSRRGQAAKLLALLFSKVSVNSVDIRGYTAELDVQEEGNKSYSLFFKSDDLSALLHISPGDSGLNVDIKEAKSRKFNTLAEGQVVVDTGTEQIRGSITANLAGSLPVVFSFWADDKQISIGGKEAGKITTITPFVDLFGLSPNIQRWITDHLDGSRYILKRFQGQLYWDNPASILDTLYAEVRVEDCEYTFAPGLEPIRSEYTDVVFSKGVLAITPHQSTFYGQGGEESWLDINFNDHKNILLTAYIKTQAVGNEDIIRLLNYYGITLPFVQVEGTTATDLTLAINLNKVRVEARGNFSIDEGAIEYDNKKYQVNDALVSLVNSDIKIDRITLGYEKLFTATASGWFQAKEQKGEIDIVVDQISVTLDKSTLTLDDANPKPELTLYLSKEGNVIDADRSFWKLDATQLDLGAFRAPISVADYSLVLPPVLVNRPPGISAKISGPLSLGSKTFDLKCELLKYEVGDWYFKSKSLMLDITFDEGIIVRTLDQSEWLLNTIETRFYPGEVRYLDDVITVADGRLQYGDFFIASISGNYDLKLKKGEFLLENIDPLKLGINKQSDLLNKTQVTLDGGQQQFKVAVPELSLLITSDSEKNLVISVSDLSVAQQHFTLLKQLKIGGGELEIRSEKNSDVATLQAQLIPEAPFLVENNNPVDELEVTGEIHEKGYTVTINDNVHIDQKGHQLKISSQGVGYNLPVLVDYLQSEPELATADPEKETKGVFLLNSVDSILFLSPNHKILADTISIESSAAQTIVELKHKDGTMTIFIRDKKFIMEGDGFNDLFMNSLVGRVDFTDGTMSMAANGGFDNFSGVWAVKDTTIADLMVMNNVMAFINTIPALATFSLPQYSTEGLPVTSAHAGFDYKDGLMTFKSVKVESPELDLAGTGWVDFKKSQLDITLNLITQAKKNVTKIPLLGYILAGEEKNPSITMEVKGDLKSPEVTQSTFKEVVMLPFDILYRTLISPTQLFESDEPLPDKAVQLLPSTAE